MKKILVAHDGSRPSSKAVRKTFEIAEKFQASVTVISVIPELFLTELTELDRARISETLTGETARMMEKIKESAQGLIAIKTVIRQGNPAEEILAEAGKMRADLIVTGSHGRHGAEKFLLGSVSSKIVDHAVCAVLVVK